jgi:hypothetical protein
MKGYMLSSLPIALTKQLWDFSGFVSVAVPPYGFGRTTPYDPFREKMRVT